MPPAIPQPEHYDYLSYLYGLAILSLSAASYAALSITGKKNPWALISAFAVVRGAVEWMRLICVALGKETIFEPVYFLATAMSCLFLFLVWALPVGKSGKRKTALVLYSIALATSFVVFFFNAGWTYLVLQLGLALPAGILSGVAFIGFSNSAGAGRGLLKTIGILLISFGLWTGLGSLSVFLISHLANQGAVAAQRSDNLILSGKVLISFAVALLAMILTAKTRRVESAPWGLDGKCIYCRWAMGALLLTAIGGYFLTSAAGVEEEKRQREEIASESGQLAVFFPYEKVVKLNGNESDLSNPDYAVLKAQLHDIVESNPDLRFAYLMGIREGKVFFYVDSENSESEDYSPPGQTYEEAEPELFRVFETGKTEVSGPLRDRWGIWVSGLSAVKNPWSEEVAAVFGVDMDATRYRRNILVQRSLAIAVISVVSALLVVFALVMLLARDRAIQMEISEAKHRIVSDFTYNGEYWMTTEGNFVYVSPAVDRILEIKAEEFIKHRELFEAAFRPEDRAALKNQQIECRETGIASSADYEIEVGGARRFVHHICAPITGNKGSFRGIRGSVIDITGRRLAEEEKDVLITELTKAITEIKTLKGLVPICAWCKKIRNDKGFWSEFEGYIMEHSEAEFSHGICPDCAKKVMEEG